MNEINKTSTNEARRGLLKKAAWSAPVVAAVSLPQHAQATEVQDPTLLEEETTPGGPQQDTTTPFVQAKIYFEKGNCYHPGDPEDPDAANRVSRSIYWFYNFSEDVDIDIISITSPFVPVPGTSMELHYPGVPYDALTSSVATGELVAPASDTTVFTSGSPINVTIPANQLFTMQLYASNADNTDPNEINLAGMVIETGCCGNFVFDSAPEGTTILTSAPI